jgi:hypothetical protein
VAEQMADGTAVSAAVEYAREFFASMHYVCEYEAQGFVGDDIRIAQLVREALSHHGRSRLIAWLSDLAADQPEYAQIGLPELRDIFGNPFRPVTFDPRWLTATVVALATGIYAERAFDRMPILADALEEAGCDHADILAHCRGDGPHVRGCWVVDLVLGKS